MSNTTQPLGNTLGPDASVHALDALDFAEEVYLRRLASQRKGLEPHVETGLQRARNHLRTYFANRRDPTSQAPKTLDAADATLIRDAVAALSGSLAAEIPEAELLAMHAPSMLARYTRQRIDKLVYEALGSSNEQCIPISILFPQKKKNPDPKAKVNAIADVIHTSTNAPSVVMITGENLDRLNDPTGTPPAPVATVGTASATLHKLGDNVAAVVINPQPAGQPPAPLSVVSKDGILPVGMVVFDLPQTPQPQPPPALAISRDSQGRITGITLQGKGLILTPDQTLQMLRDALKEGDPNLKFNMSTSGGVNYNLSSGSDVNVGPTSRP